MNSKFWCNANSLWRVLAVLWAGSGGRRVFILGGKVKVCWFSLIWCCSIIICLILDSLHFLQANESSDSSPDLFEIRFHKCCIVLRLQCSHSVNYKNFSLIHLVLVVFSKIDEVCTKTFKLKCYDLLIHC